MQISFYNYGPYIEYFHMLHCFILSIIWTVSLNSLEDKVILNCGTENLVATTYDPSQIKYYYSYFFFAHVYRKCQIPSSWLPHFLQHALSASAAV